LEIIEIIYFFWLILISINFVSDLVQFIIRKLPTKSLELSHINFFMDISLYPSMVEQEENKKEEFAREFMTEEGLKGKAKRIKVMAIIDKVGYDKDKVKVAYLRSTITERIHHE